MRGEVSWVSERTLRRSFDDPDIATANARVRALYLDVLARPDLEDAIPGARSLTVILREDVAQGGAWETLLSKDVEASAPHDSGEHVIPVRYDGVDLVQVASRCGFSVDEYVARHVEGRYVVGFIGFSPGFPYLLGLPDELAVPRRASPRPRVPAGSVAIAAPFCGIYPSATPGGWNIIGTTDVTLFDAAHPQPCSLGSGDVVRFVRA